LESSSHETSGENWAKCKPSRYRR